MSVFAAMCLAHSELMTLHPYRQETAPMPDPIPTEPEGYVYELRAETGDEYWQQLGIFATLDEIRDLIDAHDGGADTDSGGPLYDGGDDGEELWIVRHQLGRHAADGLGGTRIVDIRRDWTLTDLVGQDDDDCDGDSERVWSTTWTDLPAGG